MRAHIDVRLIDGDLLTTAVDLACFKHAQSFYGADAAAVRALTAGGRHVEHDFEVASGGAHVVASDAARSPWATTSMRVASSRSSW